MLSAHRRRLDPVITDTHHRMLLVCSQERRWPAARESHVHRLRDASGKMVGGPCSLLLSRAFPHLAQRHALRKGCMSDADGCFEERRRIVWLERHDLPPCLARVFHFFLPYQMPTFLSTLARRVIVSSILTAVLDTE